MEKEPTQKNCVTCVHLDYYEKESYEDTSPEGYSCGKREYKSRTHEERHLQLLQIPRYRKTYKKCSESVKVKIEGNECHVSMMVPAPMNLSAPHHIQNQEAAEKMVKEYFEAYPALEKFAKENT